MKRLLYLFLAIVFLAQSNAIVANADNANPPVITSVRMLDSEKLYFAGDLVVFDITFSGGNPGIKSAELSMYEYTESKILNCINHYIVFNRLSWNSETSSSYLRQDYGAIDSSTIRLFGKISSDCSPGLNRFDYYAKLFDETDLSAIKSGTININIKDGTYTPPGVLLGLAKPSRLNLNSIQSRYVIPNSGPILIDLPSKNSDGVLMYYEIDLFNAGCKLLFDYPGDISNKLLLYKSGNCTIRAFTKLSRSIFTFDELRKEIVLESQAETELKLKNEADTVEARAKDAAELKAKQEVDAKAAAELKAKQEAEAAAELKAKQEAEVKAAAELKAKQEEDAKAAADKAASELKAKQEAAAKAAAVKKRTITCVKGKLTKKVTAVKPVCPKGYKKK